MEEPRQKQDDNRVEIALAKRLDDVCNGLGIHDPILAGACQLSSADVPGAASSASI
jgi:hypothetical protein